MLIRRILVPIDFSGRSTAALDYAFALATLAGAGVDVLHVVAGPGATRAAVDVFFGRPISHTSSQELSLARQGLQQVVDASARQAIVPTLNVETGDVASGIVRFAAEAPADLIVLATRGHRGAAELILGSVAHKVIT